MIKVGDLVVPVTRKKYEDRQYVVLDIYVSEKTGERMLQIGYIAVSSAPSHALVEEGLFELVQQGEVECE